MKPDRENNVFNHEHHEMKEATGVSHEELAKRIDKTNEEISKLDDSDGINPSLIVEKLMENLSKKELAILYHCENQKSGELEDQIEAMGFIQKTLSGESSAPKGMKIIMGGKGGDA